MSYRVNTRASQPALITIGTKYDLTGHTLALELSATESFGSFTTSDVIPYFNSGAVYVSLSGAQVDAISDSYFRIKVTRPDTTTFYLGKGYIDHTGNNPTNVPADDLDAGGYVRGGSDGPHGHLSSHISDLAASINSMLVAGSNVTKVYDSTAKTITIGSTGGGSTDPEIVRDTVAAALVAGTGVTIAHDDAANTITIGSAGGGGTSDHGLLTGLGDDDHPQYYNQTRGDARYAQVSHTHTAANISDSTAVGRSVLTATDAAAARAATGAGTSNLVIGTTSTTAKAGDYTPPSDGAAGTATMRSLGTGAQQAAAGNDPRLSDARTPTSHTHVASEISDSTAVGRSLLAAASAAAARTAIELGNVSNTSDANKPISTAQQAEFDLKAYKSQVEGYVTHDGTAGGGTRPSGFYRVVWVGGSARPTNMATGDIWETNA